MKRNRLLSRGLAILLMVVLALGTFTAALAEKDPVPKGYKAVKIGEKVAYESPDGIYFMYNKEGKLLRMEVQPDPKDVKPYKEETEAPPAPQQPEPTDETPTVPVLTLEKTEPEAPPAPPAPEKGQEPVDETKPKEPEKPAEGTPPTGTTPTEPVQTTTQAKQPETPLNTDDKLELKTTPDSDATTPGTDENAITPPAADAGAGVMTNTRALLTKTAAGVTEGLQTNAMNLQQLSSIAVTSIAVNPAPQVGQASTVTVTFSGYSDGTAATGNVRLTTPGGALDLPPAGTQLQFTWTPTAAGEVTLTAVYVPGNADAYEAGQSASQQITVAGLSIAGMTADAIAAIPFDGTAKTPQPVIQTLIYGTDYQVKAGSYANNVNAGTASVTLEGIGNYTGDLMVEFTITAKDISGADITVEDIADQPYTGQPISPATVVKDTTRNVTLQATTDYTVGYSADQTNVGQVTITLTGTGNYTGTRTMTFNIIAATPTVTLEATGGKANAPITLKVTVKGVNGAPISGAAVTFEGSGRAANTAITGGNTAADGTFTTIYTPAGGAGDYGFVANVAATTNYTAGVSLIQTVTVGKADTVMALTVTGGKAEVPVTLMLTITQEAGGAVPTGTVQFMRGVQPLGNPVPVNSGTATINLGVLSHGRYEFTATYYGDGNYSPKTTDKVFIEVGKGTPGVSLVVTGGEYGQRADMRVTVQGVPGAVAPTGYVTFYRDNQPLTTVQLDRNGEARFAYTNVPTTRYTLTAVYSGNQYYLQTNSNRVALNGPDDGRQTPTISLEAKMNSNNKNATISVAVYDSYWGAWAKNKQNQYPSGAGWRAPTGTVSIYNGNVKLAEARLDYGMASIEWKDVPYGSHTLTAVYSGDVDYYNVSTTANLTRKRPSTGSGTGSGTSTTPSTPSTDGIVMRDAGGNVVENFTPPTVGTDGTVTIQTAKSLDYYSFSMQLSQLNTYKNSSTDGYVNFVTPVLNVHTPFDVVSGIEGLSDYLRSNNLSESNLELRMTIRVLDRNSIGSTYAGTNLDTAAALAYYRVDLTLYTKDGKKVDFTPGLLDVPMDLLLGGMGSAGSAMVYDELTGTFVPTGMEQGGDTISVSVVQNGVYAILGGDSGTG